MLNEHMCHWKWVPGIIGALLIYSISLAAQASEPIHACAADLEYPPYLFTQHDSQRVTLVGLAIDILQTSLKNAGEPPARIEKLPWLRCLKLVEVGEIDIVLNVPTAQIDPQPYRISEPYAVVHTIYVTSRVNSPRGIIMT